MKKTKEDTNRCSRWFTLKSGLNARLQRLDQPRLAKIAKACKTPIQLTTGYVKARGILQDLSGHYVLQVKIQNKSLYLVFFGKKELTYKATLKRAKMNLSSLLEQTYLVVHKGVAYPFFHPSGKILENAIEMGLPPNIAAVLTRLDEQTSELAR
jgi:hypothetical protein